MRIFMASFPYCPQGAVLVARAVPSMPRRFFVREAGYRLCTGVVGVARDVVDAGFRAFDGRLLRARAIRVRSGGLRGVSRGWSGILAKRR